MKVPKKTKRYCKFCKKHTEHKISQAKAGHQRGALKRGSPIRAKKRGLGRGLGSHGKWPPSKPAVTKWKRKTKTTKKTNFVYTCKVCGKSTIQKKGTRTSRVQFKEK
ncbi:MAG: 50S ribosomal protein L44e [Candidatus Pacearchaeota archaeon]|nr:MAG: 50S ribosomal protein L44e [Candidatus Pacearchaeota archaeon]